MYSTISLLAWAIIPPALAQQLLQPLPAGYPATPEVVYINNNLAVIPPPFNYTGFLLNGLFTTLNVSDAAFSAELKQASNATFIAFDPRFFDVIGTTPKVELMYNLTGILYEAPAYLPDQNLLFFSQPGSYNQFYVNLTTNPPALTNISFNPPVYAVNGARYSAKDKRLYVTSMGGNGTAASIWSADPVTLESVTLANNYRGLHLNSPDDIVVSNDTGLVYFTDPTYAYIATVDLSPEQTTRNVYLFNVTSGYLSVLDDTLGEPNGIAFSPDELILYVTDSSALEANYGLPGAPLGDDGHRTIYAYDVDKSTGRVGGKRVIYQTDQWIPDGIRVASSGNIYAATGNSIDVLDLNGVLLGKILLPSFVTNLQFTGDGGLWLVGAGPVYRVTIAEKE